VIPAQRDLTLVRDGYAVDLAPERPEVHRACNGFGIALVVLVDTPGFLPGTQQEADGVIRHGASLLRAFAEARVPRFTVVLRKAFGGAYITMNSKDLGADLVLAWSRAELGIMGAEQAVGIIHRRDLVTAGDPAVTRRDLARAYGLGLTAEAAARNGSVDEVIRPGQTRARLAFALRAADRPPDDEASRFGLRKPDEPIGAAP
jgi:acetyl-CoA carboxylase carboxyltransferase component